jgi:hypothetical protein
MNSSETSKLEEASRLIEAAEKAETLRAETTKNLSAVLKRVHSKHIFTIEAMIGRYQSDLEKAARADKKPVARIAQLKDLAQLYVPQAVAAGYQRGLSDLKTNGWLGFYTPVTPANAPQSVIQSILTENEKYLTTSLQPDLQAGMSDKARIARIKLYGHFLWKAAERAYIQAMIDFQTAVKARDRQDKVKESMVEVGNENSGNHDQAGRPGQVGGSAPSGEGSTAKTLTSDEIKSYLMGHWIGSSRDSTAHFMQMVMNEAAGKDRFDNLVTPYRSKEDLQTQYDAELRNIRALGGSEDQVKQWCAEQADKEAKAFEKFTRMGDDALGLVRGIGNVEAAALAKAIVGDRVQFRPLLSATDDEDIAKSFSRSLIHFEGVRSSDVFDSYLTEPRNGILHLQDEHETVLRGNTHDWILASKEDLGETYNPYTESRSIHNWEFTFKAAPMAEADRDTRVMVLHSNMDFGSKKIVDEAVTYKTVKPRIKVREGGRGSGNWDHVDRPGQRGGSGSTGDLNDKLRKIAQIYADAKHDPTNPATQKAYAAFIKETLDQYHDLKAAGYKFDFEDKGEPYKDQPDMRRSVQQTKTLFVRSSKDDLPDDSPLSKVVEDGQTANTIFRGVHDMYGHFFPDNTFGERGEFKAYQAHGRMYSKDALPALAAETLAQNAWVNHSPENEGKPVSQRSFPEQKSFAFPVEIADEMRHSYFPEVQNHRKYREGGVGSGNYGHDGRPGQRGGSAGGGSSIVPNIIARSIVRDGGITISTTGVRPRSGFAIAGIRNAAGDKVETVINGEAKPEDVQKFVNENKDILSQPNHYIGGWVNDGKTYLDVSEVHNDKATALDKAEARDEIAIYDLGNGEEHFTREDHLRPSESRAGRAA